MFNLPTTEIVKYIFWGLVIIAITREIACWYWKINDIQKTLDEILEELRKRP